MILKNMLAFCKKSKLIKIMYLGDVKYLSDGYMAAYIGNAAPDWTAKDCAIALDLSEDEQEKYALIDECKHEHEPVYRDDLEKVEKLQYSLNMDGMPAQPFMCSDRSVFFVNQERIRVFKDEYPKTYYIGGGKKTPLLYIEVEGRIIGMINPIKTNLEFMNDFVQNLSIGVKNSLEKCFCDAGGQISITDM